MPTVRGRDPAWEATPDTPVVAGLSTKAREILLTTAHDAVPDLRHVQPDDSIWPPLLALVVGGMLIGLIFEPMAVPIGSALVFLVLLGWFRPTNEPKPIQHDPTSGGTSTSPRGSRAARLTLIRGTCPMRTALPMALVATALAGAGCGGELERPAIRVPGGDPGRGLGVRDADALVGPSLERIASRTSIAGVLVNSPGNMARWVGDPPKVDPMTAMPRLHIDEAVVRDIVSFLYTLR